MLRSLVDLYLHLQCDEFIDYLAKEERSYTPQLFKDWVEIILKGPLVNFFPKAHINIMVFTQALRMVLDLLVTLNEVSKSQTVM